MREFVPSSIGLTGSLLIAHPNLLDPNFRRSVLFISASDLEEGSFGVILNRPSGRTVGEILPSAQFGALSRIPVFLGGPVSTDQLVFASFRWHEETERYECQHHLEMEDAEKVAHDDQAIVRAFVGYAGWSKGQLEQELSQRAWLVGKPPREILDLERCPLLWRELTSSYGPWFKLLAEAPDEPSQN